jgi:hypothetical protein
MLEKDNLKERKIWQHYCERIMYERARDEHFFSKNYLLVLL